jgi:hypothetical protein
MKRLILISSFVSLLAYKASAQTDTVPKSHVTSSNQNSDTSPPKVSHLVGLIEPIPLKEINKHIRQFIQIKDVVYGYRVLDTLEVMALGAAYPNEALTVVVYGKAFKALKASNVAGKAIVVSGYITVNQEGKDPEIFVQDPNLIHVYQ